MVETALRVPSWLWLENGRNRAVVRRAFSERLPGTITERNGKGTPAGLIAGAGFANRRRLRELLGDGLLASNNTIDGAAVVAYLDKVEGPRGYAFARIMQLADAERWARIWS